jgi:hypothetical protein
MEAVSGNLDIEVYFMSGTQTKTLSILTGSKTLIPLVFSSNAPADRTTLGLTVSVGSINSPLAVALTPDCTGVIVTGSYPGGDTVSVSAPNFGAAVVNGDVATVTVSNPAPISVTLDTSDAVPYVAAAANGTAAPAQAAASTGH